MEGDNELLCNKSSIWEMISVNGVLNSCEILEKNCSFAWFSSSIASFSFRSISREVCSIYWDFLKR